MPQLLCARPGSSRVGAGLWEARPVLEAEQIEDVVAFLTTLQAP